MRNISTIAGKEFKGYLNSPMAYIIICIFLLVTGTFFSIYLKQIDYTDTTIRGFLQYAPQLLLLFAAIITMRSLAEEKKMGTWELLLTSPVRDVDVVFGKFLAAFGIMVIMLVSRGIIRYCLKYSATRIWDQSGPVILGFCY